jgi:subtilase family serine protease
MKRQQPGGRATPWWLVMGLFAGAACGDASGPAPADTRSQMQSRPGALTFAPDLVVTEVAAPDSVRLGESFSLRVTMCNRGTAPIPEDYYNWPSLQLVLSMDDSLSMAGGGIPPANDQQQISYLSVPLMDPGQCATVRVNAYADLPVDAQGQEGAYYLGALIDYDGRVVETDETNNIFVRGRMGVGSRSDLVVKAVTGPASARLGNAFTAGVTVCNQGTEPTTIASFVEVYLSTDDALTLPTAPGTSPATDQRLVGQVPVPGLSAGQCVTRNVQAEASLPQDGQGEGAYYLGAIMDPAQAEQELREDNNAHVSGRMGVGSRSDLVVAELKGPADVPHGASFTAEVTLCNPGTEPSSSALTELYLSMDDSLTLLDPSTPLPTDQRLIGQVHTPPLYAGQCVTRSVQAHALLPQDAQGEGAYHLGAIVDPVQSEQELREDNNTFIRGLLGVGTRADLVVTAVTGPTSVQEDAEFTARVTVCNPGTAPSNPSLVELYLSMDTELSYPSLPGQSMQVPFDQRTIGSVQLPSLVPGQCLTRSVPSFAYRPLDGPFMGGAYHLSAIVDPYLSEQELREDNNAFVGERMGVGGMPDLVVTAVKAPASVRDGEPFTATVTVCNHGGGYPFGTGQVDLYLSTDATLTVPNPQDPELPGDQRWVGSAQLLYPYRGLCKEVRIQASALLPQEAMGAQGAYHLGAIVDPQGAMQELREDNNAFVGGLMGVGARADLVVTELKAPASVRDGASFTASVTVCNQGTEPVSSGSSDVELYLSTDATLSAPNPQGPALPGDQRLIGALPLPSLLAGQCVTRDVEVSALLPQETLGAPGGYHLGAIVDANEGVQELREDNNAFVSGLVGVGSGSDLVVTKVTAPASAADGAPFTATATVCNQGTEPVSSGTQWVELYLSTDTTLSAPNTAGPGMPTFTDQQRIGSASVHALFAGQCKDVSIQASALLPQEAMGAPGTYHLGILVDPYQSEPELREDNNALISGLLGVGARADLAVTAVTGPASLRDGDAFTGTVRVCNLGTQPSSGHQVDLFLSMDPTLSLAHTAEHGWLTDQQWLGGVQMPGLNVGQCMDVHVNAQVQLPQDAMGAPGTFYLGGMVDSWNSELELREDNNAFVGGLVGVGARSDLVVTELKGPASVRDGDAFTATVTVCNQGTELTSSQPRVELYLSMDTTLTLAAPPGQPTDQRAIGSVDLPPLAAGRCAARSLSVNAYLPLDAMGNAGRYYLGAIADPHHAETELREDNNVFIGSALGVGSRSDLVVTQVTAPASAVLGALFTASVTVCNAGTEPSAPTLLELYLSLDTSLTPGQSLIGSLNLSSLQPGQCVIRDMTGGASIPPGATGNEGAYYLGAIVDPYQSEPELREDNNAFIGGLLGVGNRPDLVVTAVTGPDSVRVGDTFTAQITVCNQGTEPSGANGQALVDLYLSVDTALTVPPPGSSPGAVADQRLIGSLPLAPLQPGQCVSGSLTVPADVPSAFVPSNRTLYLAAIVDPFQLELELREDNNVFVGDLLGVGHLPDLVVTEVSAPASVQHGAPFIATVKVCNVGTKASGGWMTESRVQLHLSTDTTLVMPGPNPASLPDQVMVGSRYVNAIAPGQCETIPVQATANPPPEALSGGPVYVAAIIDGIQAEEELREDNNITVGGLMDVSP